MQSEHLARLRLNDRLAHAARYPITLIVAPAGFGKSVALRDWIATANLDAVHFDVRREDNTLLAFARHFSDALRPIAPSAAAAFPALQEKILSASAATQIVSDWFVEHFKRTTGTIVVDDLHFAAADPGSIAFLADLMDRTADRMNWIVASRSDLGLPVATWLAYGRMDLPVNEYDLRFTLEESLSAARAERTDVRPSDVESLWELTEGWPVAVAIALRTRTQASDLRPAATREMLYRYLAEQVFASVSESQRQFLLATSVFSAFDVTAAEALGGTSDFIEELRRGVAFLTESSPGQFRYHDLFRDYLENELLRRGEAAWQNALSIGARLLEERQNVAAALSLYGKAKDADSILRAIERDGFQLFERGQADALGAALIVLPEELHRKSAVALGLQAMLEAARDHFEPARREFVAAIECADRDELRLMLVHRYAIEIVRQGQDCTALLEAHTGDDRVPAALRVPLLGTLATAYARAARSEEALTTITMALSLCDPTIGHDALARLYQQAAYVYSQEGIHDRAQRYAALAVDLALARDLYDVAVRAYSALYQVAYDEADDPIACLTILDKLLECARKGGSSQGRLYGLMASYDIEADRGNEAALDRIETQLAEIPGMLAQNRSEMLLPAMALRAAWHGDFERAYALLSNAHEHQNDERRAEHFCEIALYASAAGKHDEAQAAAAAAMDALESWGKPTRRALRARLMLAFLELLRGRTTPAHRHLSLAKRDLNPETTRLNALAHAATTFYRSMLGQVDAPQRVAALERLRASQFAGVARLLESLPFPSSDAGGYATLTNSEREILRLLAAGASTKEMAERTARSPHTVDAHVRSICKKLQCQGRRAAVAIATSSGWVQND